MSLKELWDEYRIAKQCESINGLFEERASDRRKPYPENPEPDVVINHKRRIGKAVWIERISIPRWFLYEVGYPEC